MTENKVRIKAVANALKDLAYDIYFVGGATVSLYADDEALFEHRPTDDIDIVLEILTRGKYYEIQEVLRRIGFVEDIKSRVICRWQYQGITVDVMPLHPDVLGFSNRWYIPGIKNAISIELDNYHKINIFPFPYFLATKVEALNNRKVDWRYSKDFEDIVKVLEARASAIIEIKQSDEAVRRFLRSECHTLSSDDKFLIEAIEAVLYPNQEPSRTQNIIKTIEEIASL